MSTTIYNEECFAFYQHRMDQLIPLNRWDYVDEKGKERGKSPRDTDWRSKGYSSAAITNAIESGNNLGFRLSDRDLVVDMDPRNMEVSLVDATRTLIDDFGMDLDAAPAVSTGSGGLHFYFTIPESWVGVRLLNEMNDLPGVEFKVVGRQVVAAGSRHPNGTQYNPWDGRSLGAIPEASAVLLTAIRKPDVDPSRLDTEVSCEQLAEMLACLDPTDYGSNEVWLRLAMSCHAATGGLGVEEFVAWSIQDPYYSDDAEVIRDRWESFKGDGITAGTLFKELIDAGHGEMIRETPQDAFDGGFSEADQEQLRRSAEAARKQSETRAVFECQKDGRPKRTVDNTKIAINALGIVARRNLLTDTNFIEGDLSILTHYYPDASGQVDDDFLHGVRSAITANFYFEPSLAQVSEALSALSLLKPYHPIREYLDDLEWDGNDRLSDFFTRYCGAPASTYATGVAEIFFKAAVGRVYRPGIKFDTMVVLEGTQGCGKSTLVQILGGEHALEGLPNKSDLNHKDVIQAIQGHWLVEIEELAAMRKTDVDSMKAFLSRTSDKARFAYAREAKEYPRQCVFVGTTNDAQYLLDSTGNRRFLPIAVETVYLQQLAEDRDQIWAQATAMWRQRPTPQALMLPEMLWNNAREEQSARRLHDPVESKLMLVLATAEENQQDFLSIDDLMEKVFSKMPGQGDQSDVRRLTRAIQAIGDSTKWRNGRRQIGGQIIKGVEKR